MADMRIYAHYDSEGIIHSAFSVDAPEGFRALLAPEPGLFVGEIDTADLDLQSDASQPEALLEIAELYKVATPLVRLTIERRFTLKREMRVNSITGSDRASSAAACCFRAFLRRSIGRRESVPLLADSGSTPSDPAGDGVDRRPADHRLGDGRVAFVIPGQPAVRGQPGEGPLDRPPARDHSESALVSWFAHNVQGGAQDRLGPVQ